MAAATSPIITDPNLPTPPAAQRKPGGKKAPGVPLIAPRVDAATLKPAGSVKIKRAGLGVLKRDGRRSGGQFSLKRLTILDTAETSMDDFTEFTLAANAEEDQAELSEIEAAEAEKSKDKEARKRAPELTQAAAGHLAKAKAIIAERNKLPGVRTLCVPLYMDPTAYPSVRDTEAVMDEDEDMYDTEAARDRVLSQQVDPFWVNPKTGATEPRNLGFGSFDPAARGNSDPNAGKAWLGTHTERTGE